MLNSIVNYAAKIGDVDDGWTINYFEQQFADYCAGGYVQFNLEVPNIMGECLIDEYKDDDEKLIEQLEEAIRQYAKENAELTELLKEILFRLSGIENPQDDKENTELSELLKEILFRLSGIEN